MGGTSTRSAKITIGGPAQMRYAARPSNASGVELGIVAEDAVLAVRKPPRRRQIRGDARALRDALVQRDHVTITNACKMAVKAGDPLTIPEMEGLLEQLAETENPYLCPHGRPIVVTISFYELDRQFKRA